MAWWQRIYPNTGDSRDMVQSSVEKILPEEMATSSSIPAWKFHKQKSLAAYSSQGHKELDTIEHTHTRIHIADPLFRIAETNTTL